MRQQRIGRDVERHAEKDIGRALIELAGQRALGDVELEQAVARRQRHLVDVRRIPGADDQPARIRIAPDHVDHIGDLVDGAAVGRRPGSPLLAIDRTELAVLVGPLVPDPHAVVVEIFDVGVAGEEPEQLVDDRLEVQLLGRHQRKAFGQVEAHLMAEHRQRAGAGAVALLHAVGENVLHQIEILAHGGLGPTSTRLSLDGAPRAAKPRPVVQPTAAKAKRPPEPAAVHIVASTAISWRSRPPP